MKPISKLLLPLLLLLLTDAAAHGQTIRPRWEKAPTSETLITHTGFTVSYNHVTLTPNWSAWDITPENLSIQVTGRTDFFTTDPDCPAPQAEYRDYSRNGLGLDRGHMAPSADFTWNVNANEQTFYLTNICPQAHVLNEGLWLELEQRCRALARHYRTPVHVICGPIYDKNHTYIGTKNKVEIPDAFFKAVLLHVKGKTYATAFILPNEPLDVREDIYDYLVNVDEITRRTGLIPFPNTNFEQPGNGYPFNITWKKNKK